MKINIVKLDWNKNLYRYDIICDKCGNISLKGIETYERPNASINDYDRCVDCMRKELDAQIKGDM